MTGNGLQPGLATAFDGASLLKVVLFELVEIFADRMVDHPRF